MDSVGADTFEGSLDCLKPLGMMISFGNASGPVPPFNHRAFWVRKDRSRSRGPTLFTHISDHTRCVRRWRGACLARSTAAEVKIHIDQRFPLDQVADAHRALEARQTTGSTILEP